MKKIIMALIFVCVLLIGYKPVIPQAQADNMKFMLVSMVEKMETVKVTQTEGVIIGVLDRKGLSRFENGDIVLTSCRGTFDTKKGFQGYSSLVFADGSTLVLSWKGPTSQSWPEGGKYRQYSMSAEYVNGTGRFEGIKGSGTFSGKAPQWDKDYKAKGFTYYEFSGTYTLPSK